MKVLALGRTEYLYESIKEIKKFHEIVGIITSSERPEYAVKASDFELLSKKIKCPYLFATSMNTNVLKFIKSCQPDIIISVNWVSILSEDVFAIVPEGILNAHFGEIPRYRGNAVINWAVINKESSVCLTIYQMQPGVLDEGEILVQKKFKLTGETYISDVVEFAKANVPRMFLQALKKIKMGKSVIKKKYGGDSFRCYPRLPMHSKIDWRESAEDINALVHASSFPYSGAYTYVKDEGKIKKLTIWKSRVVARTVKDVGTEGQIIKNDRETGESWVFTGRGVIALQEVQLDCEDKFQPGVRWKSIRMQLGIDIEEELIRLYALISQYGKRLK